MIHAHTAPPHASKIQVDPDLLGIITYAGTALDLLPLVSVTDERALTGCQNINSGVGGPTNMTAAIRSAARMLAPLPASVLKRILLIADGEPTVEVTELPETVGALPQAHIRLDAISVGDELGNRVLQTLCSMTLKGQYHDARSYDQLARSVLTEARPNQLHRRQAATVLCIDTSGSMHGPMPDGGARRIDACQQAALAFLALTRRQFGHAIR